MSGALNQIETAPGSKSKSAYIDSDFKGIFQTISIKTCLDYQKTQPPNTNCNHIPQIIEEISMNWNRRTHLHIKPVIIISTSQNLKYKENSPGLSTPKIKIPKTARNCNRVGLSSSKPGPTNHQLKKNWFSNRRRRRNQAHEIAEASPKIAQ